MIGQSVGPTTVRAIEVGVRLSWLLVVGTHGRGGVRRLVLGSVAEELIRWASCPVLTVKDASVHRARRKGA